MDACLQMMGALAPLRARGAGEEETSKASLDDIPHSVTREDEEGVVRSKLKRLHERLRRHEILELVVPKASAFCWRKSSKNFFFFFASRARHESCHTTHSSPWPLCIA